MTPEQIRASILQYAFSGKLVSQIKEEGTGESLYSQIQEERNRLTKEGIIKKEKALPNCEDIDIPSSWKLCKLGDCIDLLSGQDLPSSRYNDKKEGIVYLTGASNIDDNGNIIINRWTTSPTSVAHKGNLLLTCKGTIGKTSILDIEEAHIARQIMAITEILIDIEYLKYFIEISILELQRRAKSMIPGIDRDTVRGLDFPLPPLAEQHRIVTKIEELLPLVDRYAEAYEKLEQFNAKFPEDMKKSILQYAIQGKLVEQRPEEGTAEELYKQIQEEKARLIKEGKIKKEKPLAEITEDEIPFEIPESWKWVKLGDCTSYAQTKEKISPSEITKEMWSLDLEDIQKDTGNILVKTKASERKISGEKIRFHKGQVLYSKLRPYLKKILVAPDDGICTPELVPFNTYLIDEEYLVNVLKSPHVDYAINAVTYGVKMPRVGTDTMTNLLIPLPPLEEQHRIAAKIKELLPFCDRLVK